MQLSPHEQAQRDLSSEARRAALCLFMAQYKLTLPSNEEWRIVARQPVGQICGLPESRGRCLATNGVLCYIVNDAGGLYLGHYAWFVCDDAQPAEPAERSSTYTAPTAKLTVEQLKERYNI